MCIRDRLVSGKKTRKDHPQVMNAAVRLYSDAANAKTKMENGFDSVSYTHLDVYKRQQ